MDVNHDQYKKNRWFEMRAKKSVCEIKKNDAENDWYPLQMECHSHKNSVQGFIFHDFLARK